MSPTKRIIALIAAAMSEDNEFEHTVTTRGNTTTVTIGNDSQVVLTDNRGRLQVDYELQHGVKFDDVQARFHLGRAAASFFNGFYTASFRYFGMVQTTQPLIGRNR